MKKCIWCLQLNSDSAEEHIIPKALGCPDGFKFDDGTVCESCNNKMGHLDQAVINDFDIVSFMAGVKQKGKEQQLIHSRGNMTGGYGPEGKFLTLNMGPGVIQDSLNKPVAPFNGGERHIKGSFVKNENIEEIIFGFKFGCSKKFRRGIYKIALSSLAFFLGQNKVIGNDFNSIRGFVKKGEGDRTIFIKGSADRKYRNQVWSPYVNDKGHYSIVIRLAFVELVADLSPDQSITPELMKMSKETYGDKDWTFIPQKT